MEHSSRPTTVGGTASGSGRLPTGADRNPGQRLSRSRLHRQGQIWAGNDATRPGSSLGRRDVAATCVIPSHPSADLPTSSLQKQRLV